MSVSPTVAKEVAAEMRELGYQCDARLVQRVAGHDLASDKAPVPWSAALAANILAALADRSG